MKKKAERGFTLLELVVNLAIISILAAIAVPAYMNFRDRAKTAQVESDLHTIHIAIEQLANDTGQWPDHNQIGETSSLNIWNLAARRAGLAQTDNDFPNWNGPYINSVPTDPWGGSYFFDANYRIGGTRYAVIGSFGPNQCCRGSADSDDIVLRLPQ